MKDIKKSFEGTQINLNRLTDPATWTRLLWMLIFVIIQNLLVKPALTMLMVFQFLVVVLTGAPNQALLMFSQSLAEYSKQIALFVCFNSENRPFPVASWPE